MCLGKKLLRISIHSSKKNVNAPYPLNQVGLLPLAHVKTNVLTYPPTLAQIVRLYTDP